MDDDGLGLSSGLPATLPGTGFGLAQVRERLAARYGTRAQFTLETGPGGRGTRACIHLPLDDEPQ